MKVTVSAGSIGTQNNAEVIQVGVAGPATSPTPSAAPAPDGPPTVFVSHASSDQPLVQALVDLLVRALRLPTARVRCTSLDGHRLPTGARVSDHLRADVAGAPVFLALITEASLRSPYVLFELGARWGLGGPFFPLVPSAAVAAKVQPPLSELNMLRLDGRGELEQLLNDLGRSLACPLEPAAGYAAALERVIALAGR